MTTRKVLRNICWCALGHKCESNFFQNPTEFVTKACQQVRNTSDIAVKFLSSKLLLKSCFYAVSNHHVIHMLLYSQAFIFVFSRRIKSSTFVGFSSHILCPLTFRRFPRPICLLICLCPGIWERFLSLCAYNQQLPFTPSIQEK